MNINFELVLFWALVISGLLALCDILFFAKKRKAAHIKKMPVIIDYARSFFPVLLLVFCIRSFLYEPFRVPTGSLKPTIAIGDFLLVNKFAYGIRLPVIHTKLFQVGEPQHGDIFLFRSPPDPSIDYVKRVIGVPGDRIRYTHKVLYVNGKKMPQKWLLDTIDEDGNGNFLSVQEKEENFFGVNHLIYQNKEKADDDMQEIIVPPGMYFAMGDNRDGSTDSRAWGFVPEANIVGKAVRIWMSWDGDHYRIRWDRLGKKIV